MKPLDIIKILDRADTHYAAMKLAKGFPAESIPAIQSDQVKAIAAAIVEAINQANAQ